MTNFDLHMNRLRNQCEGELAALKCAVEALEQEHDHLPTDDGTTSNFCRVFNEAREFLAKVKK